MMRFGFLLHPDNPAAKQIAAGMVERLRDRGATAVLSVEEPAEIPDVTRVPLASLGGSIDALAVLGGDGTFLRGASLVADHGVPLLGINLGALGFMTPYTLAEASEALDAACDGRLAVEERMRLDVAVLSGGKTVQRRCFLNDAVIQRSGPHLTDLRTEIDGDNVTTYRADGLIVSTPTGSTAYNLAAGGPILTPDVPALVLTPICPHTLTNRPVVLRADARLYIENVSKHPVALSMDGLSTRELNPGDGIDVRRTARPLRVFRAPGTFFAILRQKLVWGERRL
jgi:NAD+ kinase